MVSINLSPAAGTQLRATSELLHAETSATELTGDC